MAAIAGVLRFDGRTTAGADARAAMARMSHRAPQGTHDLGDGAMAMAHGALWSTPESMHERQPVTIGERWLLAVDGRIDNRESLARSLEVGSLDLARMGDDALFARAWLKWGVALWRQVEGEFALAAWDREEHRLVLLRDRVGQRPLYYAHSAQLLAFASEPEALLGLDGISRVCDEDGLAYLLAEGFQPEDRGATLYRDVRRVQPGEVLRTSASGHVQLDRYWTMQPSAELRLDDRREYVEAFREVFGEAVRCRLRSSHRPALMLSGGIDSASVLGAARLMGQGAALRPISMVAEPAQDCDETPNILRLHEGGDGIRLPVSRLDEHPLTSALVEAALDGAHPIDNSLLYARLVHLAARAAGSNVVFDGADGDVVMHADDHYAGRLALSGHPVAAWREARQSSKVNTYLRGVSAPRILLKGMAASLQPRWMATRRHRLRDWREGGDALGPWIDRQFAQQLHLRARNLEAALSERRARRSHAEVLLASWWNPGLTRSLEGAERTAAAFGVDARHPWCDQRVLDFFLALPEEYVSRDGWTKWIARSAYAEPLGEDVAWHFGKSHLGADVARHVLQQAAERVTNLLDRAPDRLDGVVDAQALDGLRSSWRTRGSDFAHVDIDQVLMIVTLVAWMDRFDLCLG